MVGREAAQRCWWAPAGCCPVPGGPSAGSVDPGGDEVALGLGVVADASGGGRPRVVPRSRELHGVGAVVLVADQQDAGAEAERWGEQPGGDAEERDVAGDVLIAGRLSTAVVVMASSSGRLVGEVTVGRPGPASPRGEIAGLSPGHDLSLCLRLHLRDGCAAAGESGECVCADDSPDAVEEAEGQEPCQTPLRASRQIRGSRVVQRLIGGRRRRGPTSADGPDSRGACGRRSLYESRRA
jgi:hypothetical protein